MNATRGEALITWPEGADQDAKNPILIEKFLERVIDESQVTLLGELDLDSNAMYGGTTWTYAELATYLFQLPIIQSQLSKTPVESWMYPATVVVWTVSQVQHLEDGGELWTTSNFSGGHLTKLAAVFSASVEKLGLETFEERLVGSQRHLMLARLHSIIPNYALEKYSSHIKWIDEYHQPLIVGYQRIMEATDFSRSVKKLFETHPDISIDLLDRSVQTWRTGVDAGLPPKIADALTSSSHLHSRRDSSLDIEMPIVKFDDAAGELFLADWIGWSCVDIDGKSVNTHSLPQSSLFVSKGDIHNAPLLDLENGYLIFDYGGTLMRQQRSLPTTGGIILWKSDVKLNENLLSTDSFNVSAWKGWKAGWFENLPRLQLTLDDGTIRNLSSKNSIEVLDNLVKHISTPGGSSVYSAFPVTGEGQVLTVVNNLENIRTQVGPSASSVVEGAWGDFDVTIYAGLGRSKEISGFVVPGLELIGNQSPLFPEEERKLSLRYDSKWSGDTEVFLRSVDSDFIPSFTLIDPSGVKWKFEVNIQKLNWSIEFDEKVPEILEKSTKFPFKALTAIKRVVVRNVAEFDPKLSAKDVKVENSTVFSGKSRYDDVLFDLRPLRESGATDQISLNLIISGSKIEIATFNKPSAQPPKRKFTSITNLEDLKSVTLETNFFTEDDWQNFEIERRKESEALKLKLRERRR